MVQLLVKENELQNSCEEYCRDGPQNKYSNAVNNCNAIETIPKSVKSRISTQISCVVYMIMRVLIVTNSILALACL